jgi:hypothetical protein
MHVTRDGRPVRTICAWCKRVLHDGILVHGNVSHGICSPPCPEARAYGWNDYFPVPLGAERRRQ